MTKKTQNSLVSIILAVKNGERFLKRAIRSVLEQNYGNYELIVVDGHSIDQTSAIVQSDQSEKIHYIAQKHDGLADARNVGIKSSNGDLIAFLSCDDYWSASKLNLQVRYLNERPNVGYVTSRFKFFLESGYSIPKGFRKKLFRGEQTGELSETLLVRKSVFKKIGMFDQEISPADDVDWFSRAHDFKITTAQVPNVLVYKSVNDSNLSMNIELNNSNLLDILRRSIHRKRCLKSV